MGCQPVGYRIQDFPCCSTCLFGGYIELDFRVCICEIHGEPEDGDYKAIETNPLGICDAYKYKKG